MAIKVIWDNDEQTIIRQIYGGHLKREDYSVAVDEFERLAKSVMHTVHSIMDRSEVLSTTPGMVLPAMRYANSHVPPNIGLRVIVKASAFTRVMVEAGRRIAPRLMEEVYFADTLDEARAIIARHAETVKTG